MTHIADGEKERQNSKKKNVESDISDTKTTFHKTYTETNTTSESDKFDVSFSSSSNFFFLCRRLLFHFAVTFYFALCISFFRKYFAHLAQLIEVLCGTISVQNLERRYNSVWPSSPSLPSCHQTSLSICIVCSYAVLYGIAISFRDVCACAALVLVLVVVVNGLVIMF